MIFIGLIQLICAPEGGNSDRSQDLVEDEPEKFSPRTAGVTLKGGWGWGRGRVERSSSYTITRKRAVGGCVGWSLNSADSKQMSEAELRQQGWSRPLRPERTPPTPSRNTSITPSLRPNTSGSHRSSFDGTVSGTT